MSKETSSSPHFMLEEGDQVKSCCTKLVTKAWWGEHNIFGSLGNPSNMHQEVVLKGNHQVFDKME